MWFLYFIFLSFFPAVWLLLLLLDANEYYRQVGNKTTQYGWTFFILFPASESVYQKQVGPAFVCLSNPLYQPRNNAVCCRAGKILCMNKCSIYVSISNTSLPVHWKQSLFTSFCSPATNHQCHGLLQTCLQISWVGERCHAPGPHLWKWTEQYCRSLQKSCSLFHISCQAGADARATKKKSITMILPWRSSVKRFSQLVGEWYVFNLMPYCIRYLFTVLRPLNHIIIKIFMRHVNGIFTVILYYPVAS